MEENFNPVARTRANYYTPGSPVQFVCVELLKGDVSGELQHLVINGQRLVIRSVVNRYDVLVLHILFLHNLTVLVCFSVSSF